jgi:hypothetical protein
MNIERVWMFLTGGVFLLGILLTALGHINVVPPFNELGRWVLVAGLFLGFLPLLAGIGWILWEKISHRRNRTSEHVT